MPGTSTKGGEGNASVMMCDCEVDEEEESVCEGWKVGRQAK